MSTYHELKELLEALLTFPKNEEDYAGIKERIYAISPDPGWSKYVFGSDEFILKDGTLDTSAVVDKILSYKPIQLPDRSDEKIE